MKPLPKFLKYLNTPINTPEGRFDSKGEFCRWKQLQLLERAGVISNLKRQQSFRLTDKTQGQRSVFWRPDFIYNEDGKSIAEDFKSAYTAKLTAFRNKVKWFKQLHPEWTVRISDRDGVAEFK